ncbi:hypothetical protein P0R31_39635 [Bradyrhizobium yuanmingense]|uniref:hypothetical protein n=1 Tax=Bradyrhizobium yuanmingense TaxID=108015 RepID=UPI0023B99594|nr:hypothetical protein [Bradyrhizobium yuanmingense]MDF0523306.1 hypothetical protein [Bradyrhizobium yuanmingense]
MEYLNPAGLRHLPRAQLMALYARMLEAIKNLPDNAPQRAVILTNLAVIRLALRANTLSPG